MTRWWRDSDALVAIDRALAFESAIRATCRELMHIAHRKPWLIGCVDAQMVAIGSARTRHTESVERTRALLRGVAENERRRAA